MGPPESSLSNFGCERFFENINHLNDNEHLVLNIQKMHQKRRAYLKLYKILSIEENVSFLRFLFSPMYQSPSIGVHALCIPLFPAH